MQLTAWILAFDIYIERCHLTTPNQVYFFSFIALRATRMETVCDLSDRLFLFLS